MTLFPELSRRTRILICVALGIAVLALILLYAISEKKSDIQLHLAKSLIQFLVILLLGAFVADVVKRIDKQRRDDEQLATFRNDIRKRLDDCYQLAKKCRSQLRGAGITPEGCDCPANMSEDCQTAYREQMEQINEVQLDLEKIWHEIDSFRHAFSEADNIIRRVQLMSGFLRKLVNEYEANWCLLGSPADAIKAPKFKQLPHMVGPSTEGWFKEKFCDRYSEAVDFIRRDSLRAN